MDRKAANSCIITRQNDQIFSFLFEESRAVEIHCDTAVKKINIGDIYIGRIKNIAKNLNAAFVEIAPDTICYLSLDEIKNPFYTRKGSSRLPQAQDELLVQVLREGIKSKLPAVTTNLTLHGKYMLLTVGNTQLSVSSKLSDQTRERLRSFLKRMDEPEKERSFGWLLRTNAGAAQEALLEKEMFRLKRIYETMTAQAPYRTAGTCLFQTPAPYLSRLSDLYDASDTRIVTDDKPLYQEIHDFLEQYQPEDLTKLSLYQDPLLPLGKLYSLQHHLDQALSERVWLNSGGYLVIQPTEALTVIDVNTGKYEGGKKKEAAFLKINLEAAVEAARQIRLRNLSGIIIIDFINMEEKESEQRLLTLLEQELKKDPVRTTFVDLTRLSLVEITRQKRERPLGETLMKFSADFSKK